MIKDRLIYVFVGNKKEGKMDESSLSLGLRYALCRASHDSLGIYPQVTVQGDGTRMDRTPWQEGWNAAALAALNAEMLLRKWFLTIDELMRPLVEELIVNDAADLDVDNESITLLLNCNDMFAWACADAEPLPLEKVAEYHSAWKAGNGDLWICRQRNMRPQKPIVDAMKESGAWAAEWETLPPNPYDAHCGASETCDIHGTQTSSASSG